MYQIDPMKKLNNGFKACLTRNDFRLTVYYYDMTG